MNAETPTRIITHDLDPEAAYSLGWGDHIAALEATADGETALIAARYARRLETLLDRIDVIEPHPHLEPPAVEVFDAEDEEL